MRTTAKMGLASWDQPVDPYNYAQFAGNWQIVDYHDHTPGHGTPIGAGGLAPGSVLDTSIAAGVVGPQHLSLALIQNLGLNGSGSTGRGYWSKAAVDTTSSGTFVSFGDSVASVVLAAGGFFDIGYRALWKVTAGTGTADIFLGSTEVAAGTTVNAAAAPAPATTTAINLSPLYSNGGGLGTNASSGTGASEVTTGEVIGNFVRVFAAAGTYTVGVEYKVAGGGTLTTQNRQLWVIAHNFE